MELYGAIDLHSTNNVTVLIDEQDEVVYQKRLSNDLALVLEQLSPYQLSIQGIVEKGVKTALGSLAVDFRSLLPSG